MHAPLVNAIGPRIAIGQHLALPTELKQTAIRADRQRRMRLSVESQSLMSLPGLYERSSTQVRLTKHGIKLSGSKLKAAGIEYSEHTEFRMEFDEEHQQIILTKSGVSTGQNDHEEFDDAIQS